MSHSVTIGILWVVICVTLGDETAKSGDEVCKDAECNTLVTQIKKQMGTSQPCDDFYNYVCGKWNGSKELKPKEIKTKAVSDLIALLEAAFEPPTEHLNATDKLINAYKSCTTADKQTSRVFCVRVYDFAFLSKR